MLALLAERAKFAIQCWTFGHGVEYFPDQADCQERLFRFDWLWACYKDRSIDRSEENRRPTSSICMELSSCKRSAERRRSLQLIRSNQRSCGFSAEALQAVMR